MEKENLMRLKGNKHTNVCVHTYICIFVIHRNESSGRGEWLGVKQEAVPPR